VIADAISPNKKKVSVKFDNRKRIVDSIVTVSRLSLRQPPY